MHTTRREFLGQSVGAAALVASGWSLPGFLGRTAVASTSRHADRILVIVQMSGGNDGLNTVIPFRDDEYHKARPTLRIAPDRALLLDDDLALHPDMTAFKAMYDRGLLHVLTNVGYPNPDRSHFRSMDIWHTASLRPEDAKDGWLGRVVDRRTRGSTTPVALNLDDGAVPLALKARDQAVPSVRSIDAFRLAQGGADLQRAIAAPRPGPTDDLLFVQRVAVSSCANARRIEQVGAPSSHGARYPGYGLADRLRQIAQLIGAEFGASIYYTSLGGFDTHAKQVLAHGPLLRELAESVSAFYADLKARGLAERVVLMTFSEFGRRVNENGSQGTDHGAAAPMFIVGPACTPGITGGHPDLAGLVDGDVPHRLDFRQAYGTLLDGWLGVNQADVLGERFDPLAILR